MSRLLQTLRLVRPTTALRPMVARPATMIRGYPARSEMNESDAKKLQTEKQANLKGEDKPSQTMEHAPGWNEVLASDSEANVKAEKEDLSNVTVEQLQEKTVKHVKAKHH